MREYISRMFFYPQIKILILKIGLTSYFLITKLKKIFKKKFQIFYKEKLALRLFQQDNILKNLRLIMAIVPAVTECKSIAEVHQQSALINRMASDLVNEPIVQQGYMASGQVPATVFVNVASMAKKRLGSMFPAADWKAPMYERLMAEAKLICAECIHLKYECRARRQPYDHLKDATIRIKKLVRDMFTLYYDHIKLLEAQDAVSESPDNTGKPAV